jgi:hypothetical protein
MPRSAPCDEMSHLPANNCLLLLSFFFLYLARTTRTGSRGTRIKEEGGLRSWLPGHALETELVVPPDDGRGRAGQQPPLASRGGGPGGRSGASSTSIVRSPSIGLATECVVGTDGYSPEEILFLGSLTTPDTVIVLFGSLAGNALR